METAQESEPRQDLAEMDAVTRPLLGADEVRASLEAVRRAQAAARVRARRETRWARVIATGALMAVGATAWAAAHRAPKARVVASSPKLVALATPALATPASSIVQAAPPAERPASAEAVAPVEPASPAVFADAGSHIALCDAAYEQRNWTAISATCPAAFKARPQDGALAMRVAQAEHRRGYTATAADWARKALALDADTPEALVIVAHAEKVAGHPHAATDAYRRYLALAPRGWHAAEARRAVRAAH